MREAYVKLNANPYISIGKDCEETYTLNISR
jgi:hypothetical protein